MSKKINITLSILLFISLGYGLKAYWDYSSLHPSTEDAYVQAEILSVSPRVSGQVVFVAVDDFMDVKRGDLLLKIDAQPFQLAVTAAAASYQLAIQQHQVQDSQVTQAISTLEGARAELAEAQIEYKRTMALVEKKLMSFQDGDSARTKLSDAQATLEVSQSQLEQAIATRGSKDLESAVVKQAAASLGQAELNLSYTEITALHDGILGEVDTQVGSNVSIGQSLFPLVKADSYWIEANFKEGDMALLKTGQIAEIEVDMFSSYRWHGVLESISPASGSAFSLLPPENATGNWVKISQRFPVKVSIVNKKDAPPLRVGASARVTINTLAN